jgi:hypothetical protein
MEGMKSAGFFGMVSDNPIDRRNDNGGDSVCYGVGRERGLLSRFDAEIAFDVSQAAMNVVGGIAGRVALNAQTGGPQGSTISPCGSFQRSHRPANENSPLSRGRMKYGCFGPLLASGIRRNRRQG